MDKYQSALIELARCTKKVLGLKNAISYELMKSAQAFEDSLEKHGNGSVVYPENWKAGNVNGWLANAFAPETDYDGSGIWLEPEEIREYLRANCMHAYRAYDLILARKQAKKELGIAKRRVTFLANRLLESQG